MTVSIVEVTEEAWTYEARAWSDDQEIYLRRMGEMFWTVPLADMGREGWELVGLSAENAEMPSYVKGWEAATSRPVRMSFFFKRPVG